MRIPHFFRSRQVLRWLLAASVFALILVASSSSMLRGSLIDDRMTALADTNHDARLSVKEMRRVIVKMIQAVIIHDLAYDVNADGSVNAGDVSLLVSSIRLHLTQSGARAYIVNASNNTLQTIDVTQNAPVALGTVQTGTEPLGVVARGAYAYVVNGRGNTLQIFNILDPRTPVSVRAVPTGKYPRSIAMQGDFLYVLNMEDATLQTFDLADPRSPASVAVIATDRAPMKLHVVGAMGLVTYNDGGLGMFDLTDPRLPQKMGVTLTFRSPSVAMHDGIAYVAAGAYLDLYDLSDPFNLPHIGQFATVSTELHDIAIRDQYAYVLGVDGATQTLQIFDLSDRVNPVSVETVPLAGGADGIKILENRAYILHADGRKMEVFDLTIPTDPVSLGSVSTGLAPFDIALVQED